MLDISLLKNNLSLKRYQANDQSFIFLSKILTNELTNCKNRSEELDRTAINTI